MKICLTKKDVIWSYVGTLMSMGSNLLMLPFLMYFLDESTLGLWYVFASVGTVATLFDFGFAVTFARNITYCWSGAEKLRKEDVVFSGNREPDFHLMNQVLTTCKVVYGILSGIVFVLLLTFGTVYILYVSQELSGINHMLAWFLYALAAFLNLYYGYYSSFLRGVGAVDQANKNTIIARLAQIILTVILLVCGTGIIGASIAYLAYGTVFRLLGKYYFYKFENIKERLAQVEEKTSFAQMKNMLGIVWHNAWRDGMISVCNYFCNQASTVICSIYLSLAETGIYSIGVQIASAIAQIAGTLYNAYQPELQSSYVNSDKGKMQKIMSVIVMSFIYLMILGTTIFIMFGMPILRIIKPASIVSVPALLGLCVYQFVLKFRNCYTSYFSCTNRIIYMNGFIVSAIFCVVLSVIAGGFLKWGMWGLIIAQILSQVIYNVWKWPVKAHKELEISFKELARIGTKELADTMGNQFKKHE